ncbi:flavin-dependent L-tryptophan oxidase RebO precursor [Oxobacter pfennigii]|uniref:Flavin-dependent L-tryptophan oxidase RebO n=1 Tax=Oxobacter pfennigii TaxID=36849 RepID=A0A0P9ADQ6_9CLOT|nr:FAD-dependent oxidoreductase [Oxobacter pfennigii]KPU43306.1 flavin-dependent L-tryptophan oxidase RebO precursor [Oxobacter pfennigii]
MKHKLKCIEFIGRDRLMHYTNINVPYQVDNPTREQRHQMLMQHLVEEGRPEDFKNIIEILNPPPDITTVCPKGYGKNSKIAVIGAGEAGLSAAFELRKIGCNITLFEAAGRIGGRINTHYFTDDKKYFAELGAMRIPLSHEATWHYINLFKLETSPFVINNIRNFFYIRNARAVNDPQGLSVMKNIYPQFSLTHEERKRPWQALEELVFSKYLYTLSPDERRELIEIKPKYSYKIQERDMMTRRMAYEGAGLSQSAISMLGNMALLEQNLIGLSFIQQLQEIYTADFGATYYINGGMIKLPLALYGALCDDTTDAYVNISKDELGQVNFKIGFAVDGIYGSPEGDGVILQYRDGKRGGCYYEKFDYVICTMPFSSLRRAKINPLFSEEKSQAIIELNYENAQKTFFFLKDRFWEYGNPCTRIVGGNTLTDLPNTSVFYPSDHAMPIPNLKNGWTLRPGASPSEPGVLLASYNWSMDADRIGNEYPSLRIDDIKGYIERIHGLPFEYIDNKFISSITFRWGQVQYMWGGAAIMKPQDKILFSYVVTLPEMNGKVFFAGEHISQKHAWQQGSFQTAMVAANKVAERIKAKKS